MATFKDRYGSSVRGLPLWLRVAITVPLLVPVALGLLAALTPGIGEWRALGVIVVVLGSVPAYMLLPSVWERTDESVAQDWEARRLQQSLQSEIDGTPEEPLGIADREPPPTRW